ncbi:hydroxyacylglutathione hydrolase, partial [Vibrio parahaemolyticus V-223/04]
AHQSRCLSL